jgi:hypothetical protein
MEHQEGYADGLAGAGLQDRTVDGQADTQYINGFILGSLDRKEMLKNNS